MLDEMTDTRTHTTYYFMEQLESQPPLPSNQVSLIRRGGLGQKNSLNLTEDLNKIAYNYHWTNLKRSWNVEFKTIVLFLFYL